MNKLYAGLVLVGLGLGISFIKKKPNVEKKEVVERLEPKDLFKKILRDRNIRYVDSPKRGHTCHGFIETNRYEFKFDHVDEEKDYDNLTDIMIDFIDGTYGLDGIGSLDIVYLNDISMTCEFDMSRGCDVNTLKYVLYVYPANCLGDLDLGDLDEDAFGYDCW